MVGIVNLDGAPIERSLLERLTDFMAFRGPDGQDVWLERNVGFGHTMLRTTFESASEHQPCSLDGHVWIVADARVDGRSDLIRKLETERRHGLTTVPDVELILHAYHAWGEDCVRHLIGDFAFAIWDGPRRRLFCARDHLGVKPFFFARVANFLVFSNTLNCVRRHPAVSDTLNDSVIADFLLWDYNQHEGTTTFADINRLPPAHSMTWSGGAPRLRRYWTLPVDRPIRYKRSADYVEHFREIFRAAVDDRLRANYLAVSLSGGLDSSSVAATAVELLRRKAQGFELRAYTTVYDRLLPGDRERYYAGLVAKGLGIPISYLVLDEYRLYERWDQAELRRPQPASDPLLAIFVDLLKTAAADSRVLLDGDGGDPLFLPAVLVDLLGVEPLTQVIANLTEYVLVWRRLPPLGIRSRLKRRLGVRPQRPPFPLWLNPEFAACLELPARWERHFADQEDRKLSQVHQRRDAAYRQFTSPFWSYMFEFQDPGETMIPIEVRHPFFDTRLIRFGLALPPIPWCVRKTLVRLAMPKGIPDEVRWRPKTPLVGDPRMARLRESGAAALEPFVPVPELAKYVDGGAVPRVLVDGDPNEVWMNLRPRALNYWLRYSRPAQTKECSLGVSQEGV
jgi:asparagine synthase (glutamine-hydrolysing)